LVAMFRDRPMLVAEVITDLFGVSVPAFEQACVSSGELTDVSPTEYRADAVITLTVGGTPVLGVVVEVQLRAVPQKRYVWPAYVAALHSRLKCPVLLLAVCPDPAGAAWCAEPIVVGDPSGDPGLVLRPVVLGPAQVPVLTDPTLARAQPEVAVLSAMAHGERSGQKGVFDALLAALEVVDHDHAKLYADLVLTALPPTV